MILTIDDCYYRSDSQIDQEVLLGADGKSPERAGLAAPFGKGEMWEGWPSEGKGPTCSSCHSVSGRSGTIFSSSPHQAFISSGRGSAPAPCCQPGWHIRDQDHLARISRGVKCSAPIKARGVAGWGLRSCLQGSETLWKEPKISSTLGITLISGFALELFISAFKCRGPG